MKIFVSILFIIIFFIDTADTFPTSGTIANRTGGVDNWNNPGNITADDGSVSQVSSSSQSHYLISSGYGFNIPAKAVINSVTVKIELSSAFGSRNFDAQLQDDNGSLTGSSKFVVVSGATPTVYTYSVDNWSATLTPTIINDPDFGVRFWVTSLSDLSIDYVTVSINYTNRQMIIIN